MAQNKGFGIEFDGFLDFARDLDNIGTDFLKNAVTQTLELTKDYVNNEVEKAMNSGRYHFDAGQGYSQGKAKASFEKVKQKPVEWSGTTAIAQTGVDLADAPEILFIIYGTPHMAKDKALYNAIKVKGKVKKNVEKIQADAFANALEVAKVWNNLVGRR